MTNDFIDKLKDRRSIRKFEDKPIDKNILEEIIQAGKYAPSADNKQPWRFIVIQNNDAIQDISKSIKKEIKKILKKRHLLKFFFPQLKKRETIGLLYGAAMAPKDVIFHNAPALILIVTKKGLFNNESCACCAQNMMLAADSIGIGSCWIGFANFLERNKNKTNEIGIPEDYHIAAAIVFGHPIKKPKNARPRKPMANVIKWIN